MDMYSKMDGSAPVSSAVDGVWGIQKKGRIDDQRNGKGRKGRDRIEEEEEFEDGLVPREQEESAAAEEKESDKGGTGADSKNEDPSTTRKIDIII